MESIDVVGGLIGALWMGGSILLTWGLAQSHARKSWKQREQEIRAELACTDPPVVYDLERERREARLLSALVGKTPSPGPLPEHLHYEPPLPAPEGSSG